MPTYALQKVGYRDSICIATIDPYLRALSVCTYTLWNGYLTETILLIYSPNNNNNQDSNRTL